jgi:predicted ferric reductase
MELSMNAKLPEQSEYESTISTRTFLLALLAMAFGTLLASVLLPSMAPNLAATLLGSDPKAFWYLSRGSAFVSMSLLWLSMALGLSITNKMARTWPGAPAAFAIHEYVSLLGLAFAIFHALVLMGDHYIKFTLAQILVPFAAVAYKPLLVGLGQVGFYIWLLVALSFYVRSRIGPKAWRAIHYISFLSYCVALYHGISSGTDTKMAWAQYYYWISGASLIFLLMHRIVVTITAKFSKPAPRSRTVTTAPLNETRSEVG